MEALQGRWRPLIVMAIFTGLRASELRGLRWRDVLFDSWEILVRQRADCFNVIGRPKSAAGERSVPMTPLVLNTLKEWRVACPKSAGDLVFPNGAGNVESLTNIRRRGLIPAMTAAGVSVRAKPNIRACTRSAISTPRGASTAVLTAG